MRESSYAEGVATTCATAGGADTSFFKAFGIVTEFNLNPALTRGNISGIGNQTRTNDPILQENYELSISVLWQDDASQGTIHQFLEDLEDQSYDASYLIRIRSLNDGSNDEFLYLLGCVLQNFSVKTNVGDFLVVDLSFKCKQIHNDDWVASVVSDDYDYVIDDLHVCASLGLHSEISNNMDDNEAIEFASTAGASGDSGLYLLVIGLDTDDVTYKTEIIGPLAADNTYVAGSVLWSGGDHDIMGLVLLSSSSITANTTCSGTVTVRSATTNTTIATFTSGQGARGVVICDPDKAANGARVASEVLYAVADSANTDRICLVGLDENSAAEVTGITLNGATPVSSVDQYSLVYYIALGDLTATNAVRVYGTTHYDPVAYYQCTINFPADLIVLDNQLQEITLEYNTNAIPIWNFSDSTLYKNVDGAHEITVSGTAYADGTTMGSGALLSKLISASGTGDIVLKVGSYWEFNIIAASYDNISYPLKEKDLIVLDFSMGANSCTLDVQ